MFGLMSEREATDRIHFWQSRYEQAKADISAQRAYRAINENMYRTWHRELVISNRALVKHAATIKRLKARIKQLEKATNDCTNDNTV